MKYRPKTAAPSLSMTRGQCLDLAETLASRWFDGHTDEVLDEIITKPHPTAMLLAVYVSKELDEVFNEGGAFRAALADRCALQPRHAATTQGQFVYFYKETTSHGEDVGWYWRDTSSLHNEPVGPFDTKDAAIKNSKVGT